MAYSRPQGARADAGGDGVGGVVEAVDVVEGDGQAQHDEQGRRRRRQACLTTIRSITLAASSHASIACSSHVVDVLPLDDVDRVVAVLEELGHRLADDPVAFVLQPMDLDPVLLHALEVAQLGERGGDLLALADDDLGLLHARSAIGCVDPVEDAGVGDLLDQVDDVVQTVDQRVDVLAVERRDEGRFQLVADVVADLVAGVLGVAQLAGQCARARRSCGRTARAGARRPGRSVRRRRTGRRTSPRAGSAANASGRNPLGRWGGSNLGDDRVAARCRSRARHGQQTGVDHGQPKRAARLRRPPAERTMVPPSTDRTASAALDAADFDPEEEAIA